MQAADYRNLGDVVRPVGGADRGKTAVIYEDQHYDYAHLDAQSNRFANLVIERGVEIGDRVAVLSKNNAAYLDLLFGCAKAGAIFVPLNWRLAPAEIAWIIADADPRLLFVEPGLEDLLDHNATETISLTDAPLHDDRDVRRPVGRDDVAMLVYTSGTTGHPKGAMLTHGNFVRHCALDGPDVQPWTGIVRDEIVLNVLPLFHVGGLEMTLRPLFTGATVVIHRDFDVARILADIARLRITFTGLVPTALQMMLDHPAAADVDFTSLRYFLYGAAPIPLPLLKRAVARMKCDFVQAYGMTEANSVFVMLAPDDHRDPEADRLKSAGKPTFDTQLRVVDPENRPVPAGTVGEIVVRGSSVMKGYWRRPDATAEAIDADGWLHSGDAGYRDADGFVYVCDRIKDMICSGGENIYPAEVESALFDHPAVAEVAVVGRPDERWGETVHAVVTAAPGATVDADELIAWARARIASYKVPRSIEVVAALPKNGAGKILRRQVRDRCS